MNLEIKLPKDYIPFENIILCSNRLSAILVPILVNNIPILLIGKGEFPKLWLKAPIDKGARNWDYIVKGGLSLFPYIKVHYYDDHDIVKIKLNDKLLISAHKVNQNTVNISEIDLREIGINIYGSNEGLTIGGSKLINNSFSHMKVAFALEIQQSVQNQ